MGQIVGGIETKNLTSLNGLQALVAASGHYVDPLRWRDGIQGLGGLGDLGGIEPTLLLGPDEQWDYTYVDPAVSWGMIPPQTDGIGIGDLGASLTPGLHALSMHDPHQNPIHPGSRTSGLRWMGSGNAVRDFVDEQTDDAARGGMPGVFDLPTFYSLGELGCAACGGNCDGGLG